MFLCVRVTAHAHTDTLVLANGHTFLKPLARKNRPQASTQYMRDHLQLYRSSPDVHACPSSNKHRLPSRHSIPSSSRCREMLTICQNAVVLCILYGRPNSHSSFTVWATTIWVGAREWIEEIEPHWRTSFASQDLTMKLLNFLHGFPLKKTTRHTYIYRRITFR